MKKILVLVSLIAIGVLSYYFYNQNNTQVSTELYEYVKIEKWSIKKVGKKQNKANGRKKTFYIFQRVCFLQ